MEIKDILKNRRLELGLTLEDVAKAVGVSVSTISRWESGDIENMRRDKIPVICLPLSLVLSGFSFFPWRILWHTMGQKVLIFSSNNNMVK